MELHDLKRKLQAHLTDGLVLIVGSGVSSEVGLPSMATLAAHLLKNPPSTMSRPVEKQWVEVTSRLEEGKDLEAALNQVELSEMLETHVIQQTAGLLESEERKVIQAVVAGECELPLSRVFRHLMATANSLSVITTNYDRLIELAAESANVGVDTMFHGHMMGTFDPVSSREALGRAVTARKRKGIKRFYRKHIKVFKPHGSLDWFNCNGSPVCCGIPLSLPRLMIAPGKTKFLRGYDIPFDRHREEANAALDRAARLLVLGFGFNDKQLETHLRPTLEKGTQTVILARTLTRNALAIVQSMPSVLALSELNDGKRQGTRFTTSKEEVDYESISLWNLLGFCDEVLA